MREHCRTQHNYDPDPIPRPPLGGQRKTMELVNSTASAPVEKFLKMMANSRFQQTGITNPTGEHIMNSMGSIENALNFLLDNYVFFSKKEFHGISGYFCKKCLTFQYRYIRNIWDEMTAKGGHVHVPNAQYDANRPAKELEVRTQANRLLIELTNSLFGSSKILEVNRCDPFANFHGPVLNFYTLNPAHWAAIAILSSGSISSNSIINDFITNVEGTYAQIIVGSGPLAGSYLMSIHSVG